MDITKNIKILEVENTNLCNFNCCFCPHDKMKREKGIMNIELFKKIVNEVKDWNLRCLLIVGCGEPLFDPSLAAKIKYARENMPKKCIIASTTNASLLTEERFKSLIESGLDELRISCYASNPENFKKIHGINKFKEVEKNIKKLKKIKKSLGVSSPLICMGLLQPPESEEDRSTWYKYWNKYFDKFYHETKEITNFGDGLNIKKVYKNTSRLSCERPFSMGQILWNGDVCLCVSDYEGKNLYGNVKTNSLKRIMMSPLYQGMLKIHKKRQFKKIPLCDNCDQLIPATLRNRAARFKCKFIEGRYAGG